jgi:hypothetical protein
MVAPGRGGFAIPSPQSVASRQLPGCRQLAHMEKLSTDILKSLAVGRGTLPENTGGWNYTGRTSPRSTSGADVDSLRVMSSKQSKNACKLYWINDSWPGKLALAARPGGGDGLPDEVADWKRAGSESGFVGRKKCPCALSSGSGTHRIACRMSAGEKGPKSWRGNRQNLWRSRRRRSRN